jgi:Na+/melibiose symporter-like transporter
MTMFGFLFGIDILIAAIMLYFFTVGLGDGSVSSFNLLLWLALLLGIAAMLGTGFMLHARNYRLWSNLLLGVLAWPGLLFGLWCLAMIILQPRWN